MRNFLYDAVLPKAEPIGWASSTLGFVLKWTLQPGGDVVLVVGMGTLAVIYFLQAFSRGKYLDDAAGIFYQLFPDSELIPFENLSFFADMVAPKAANMGAGVVLIGTVGALFSWKGSLILLLVGCGSMLIALVAMAYVGRINRKHVIIFALGISTLAVPQETLIRQFHRNDPVLVQLLLYRRHHPHNQAANEAVRQYRQAQRK